MKQSKIIVSAKVINTVAESWVLSETEKLRFLRYVGYLTYDEQQQLCQMI